MKIVVAVKQVKVVGDEFEFTPDGLDVDGSYVDGTLNEWDAFATEEALRIRERLGDGEVVVVTVGDEEAEDALRRCLGMGADRAARVDSDVADPLATARALAEYVAGEEPDLVLCGVQSSDSVQGATGTALAELLEMPRVAVVTRLDWPGSGPAVAHRELEGGLADVVEVDTPALLTIQSGINEPRYVTLRATRNAEQAEIPVIPFTDTVEPAYRITRMFTPPRGAGATMLDGGPPEAAQRILEIVRERLA